MPTTLELVNARQRRHIQVTDSARTQAMRWWGQMDFADLDTSWAVVGPELVHVATAAQLTLAASSDQFTAKLSKSYQFTETVSVLVPEAFVGVDGAGRDMEGILYGAVTTTKRAVGSGLGRYDALLAGQAYLGAIMSTVVADIARSADKSSAAGRGYTTYVRAISAGACSRCAILAGKTSAQTAFKRHLSCHCYAVGIPHEGRSKVPSGMFDDPHSYFDSLSKAEQDRVFTKAGAEAIREGASVREVVGARRGAAGISYSHRITTRTTARRTMQKTTIGYRPSGAPVQVYTTAEGTTRRGVYGSQQARFARGDGRYSTATRVRLMPEEIFTIAGDDTALRQAFLRDAGYLEYVPANGYGPNWIAEIEARRRADRILVDRATLRYDNFTLG